MPTRSTPTRSTSHDINFHEVNSHQINFPRHQLPRHQLPRGQLPPDQLPTTSTPTTSTPMRSTPTRSTPNKSYEMWQCLSQHGVSLQRIVHFKEMHHFKHYLVINHCHIWISKVELVVVGRYSWLKKNFIPIFLRSLMWCERSKVPRKWSQCYAAFLKKKYVQKNVRLSTLFAWEISEWGVQLSWLFVCAF